MSSSPLTGASHSAHVTIGVGVYTWVELFSELAAFSKNVPSFRESLPAGFATRPESSSMLREGLIERIKELQERADYDGLIDEFTRKIRAAWRAPPEAFRLNPRLIGPKTTLKAPEKHRYRVTSENGATVLVFDGKRHVLPAAIRPTLDALCARKSFQPAELPTTLDEHAVVSFMRYLDGEGFLKRID